MAKKVIKASKADEKVKELTQDKPKNRSAKDIRSKLYGAKE